MSKIIIVTGSVRPGRVTDKVLPLVKTRIEAADLTAETVDLKDLGLPFFDSEQPASSPDFHPTNPQVIRWTKAVADADGVVLLMPEYNHTMTAVQKNAIDWIYKEWQGKPVAIVAYGWSGGSRAIETAERVLGNVKAQVLPANTKLHFMKELNPDGTVIDETSVSQQLEATVAELKTSLTISSTAISQPALS